MLPAYQLIAVEVLTAMKGISSYEEALSIATKENIDAIKVRVIHFRHLIEAKKSAGRYKERIDIENLPSLE